MKNSQHRTPFLYTAFIYMCGLFLFLEWLYPLEELADIANLRVFIMYTVFCFLISVCRLKWWLSWIIKGSGLLILMNNLYFIPSIFDTLWIQQLFVDLSFNFQALYAEKWYVLTDSFRSLLFLIIIWMISYIIHYWIVVMRRVFLFIILTIVYVAVLDTLTDYTAELAIIRIFFLSFIMLGLANLSRVVDQEGIHFTWMKRAKTWLIPLIILVLLASVIGYMTPVYGPKWADPLPSLKGKVENIRIANSNKGIRKVGYGENDSELGGSFIQDYTEVFQATSASENYWRIETKDTYTGKGWERSKSPQYDVQENGQISLETFTSNVEIEELQAELKFGKSVSIDKLVYPYGISQVDTAEEAEYLLDTDSGIIQTKVNDAYVSLQQYKVTYDNPLFGSNQLREAVGEDPANIAEQYRQLPEDLPERVSTLAKEITTGQNNRYDRASAMESYFGEAGFVYQISDVLIPGEAEDYVDQFLFDSQAGYCDNYSTSMVVMLRTLDIPARWVKGFTSGEKIGSEADLNVYEVTNANAHSWVEVYFPEIGWVPFEPTQGFANLSEFDRPENLDVKEELEEDFEEEVAVEEKLSSTEKETLESEADIKNQATAFQVNWLYVATGISICLLLLFILYNRRYHLRTMLLLKKSRKSGDGIYEETYDHLLAVLKHKAILRKPDQTLREYALEIDLLYESNEMSLLTNYYEDLLYNEVSIINKSEYMELWKIFIKRVMA